MPRRTMVSSILLLGLCFGFQSYNHALYISVIDIEIDSKGGGDIHFKIFQDDLADAVFDFSQKRYDGKNLSNTSYQKQIKYWLEDHFSLTYDIGVQQTFDIDSFLLEGEAAFISGKFYAPLLLEKVKIECDFLLELFPSQTNIVNIEYGGQNYYSKLDKNNVSETIAF